MDKLRKGLYKILPAERIKMRLIDRYAYAGDASHYYLVPKAVIQPISIEEIKSLFEFSHREKINITFRAGGTSLSGQGVTDGILVDLSNFWRRIVVENNGATVRVEPAVIGANVNIALKRYGRKIGPDPASINAAMMGGILSNNSSGMCCGVVQNSYHTLKHMTFVLPNGMVFNTELPDDYKRFVSEAKEIADELLTLKNEIQGNETLVRRIRKKYKQKNTVGYCMNAFLDFEHPLDILTHLIVGGEGTLAFIAEAVLHTVPDLPYKMTGILYFENPVIACNTITDLKNTGAAALEFMDRASLRSVEQMPGVPALLKELPLHASAILCEFQDTSEAALLEQYANALTLLTQLPLLVDPYFTLNSGEQAMMWKIRKGMYPSVASMRARGTSALMEDFTFPVERLGEAVIDVQRLFEKYRYENGIIFGHAKDGNLHFVISQSFLTRDDINHYEKFNDELFDLVVDKYDGALKAEHSTGRAVSAYVEKEWGPDAYRIMKRLKNLLDPENLLNPGIIITEDKLTHLHHLKVLPEVEEEVDKCIECGFCERSCPSRDLTLTPRRRIALRRAVKRLEMTGDHTTRRAILRDYKYDGMATCAVDGMCATNCPVDINTGDLIKRLRRENHSAFNKRIAIQVARHFAFLEGLAKWGIKTGFLANRLLGKNFMQQVTRGLKKIVPAFPVWSNHMLLPGKQIKSQYTAAQNGQVVYFSSCISRMMGGDIGEVFLSVCKKANIAVIVLPQTKATCCGQIFSSKGYSEAFHIKANETIESLWQFSSEGKIPIVIDVTSCTQTIISSKAVLSDVNKSRYDQLVLVDVIDFAAVMLLPALKIQKPKESIVFHPVCSVHKMNSLANLQSIGNACAKKADIPVFSGCCGMAGDRGFYFPELTKAATRIESLEVKQSGYDGYYSSSRTCEMALSEAVGKEYESVLKLLDEVSV